MTSKLDEKSTEDIVSTSARNDNNDEDGTNIDSDNSTLTANTENKEKTHTSHPDKGTNPKGDRVTRHSLLMQEAAMKREKYLTMDLESKRKLYRSKHVELKDVNTWPEYYHYHIVLKGNKGNSKKSVSANTEQREVREDLNKKMSIFMGDITTLEIDAIVNAANESLRGGGGVDGAIHRAAGPDLLAECITLDGCEPGDAKITCGYNLPARYVIHTVGPRGEKEKVLKRCYIKCLELVKKHKLKTVAFPCISTGVFGYPNSRAAKVVLETLREWLETDEYATDMERIILCLFLKIDVDIYNRLMPIYFPVASKTDAKPISGGESSVQKKATDNSVEKSDNKE